MQRYGVISLKSCGSLPQIGTRVHNVHKIIAYIVIILGGCSGYFWGFIYTEREIVKSGLMISGDANTYHLSLL
jgi:hypothetical protein